MPKILIELWGNMMPRQILSFPWYFPSAGQANWIWSSKEGSFLVVWNHLTLIYSYSECSCKHSSSTLMFMNQLALM